MDYYAKIETENYSYNEIFEADSNDEAVDISFDLRRKVEDETEEIARCDLFVWIDFGTNQRTDREWRHLHTTALVQN